MCVIPVLFPGDTQNQQKEKFLLLEKQKMQHVVQGGVKAVLQNVGIWGLLFLARASLPRSTTCLHC